MTQAKRAEHVAEKAPTNIRVQVYSFCTFTMCKQTEDHTRRFWSLSGSRLTSGYAGSGR